MASVKAIILQQSGGTVNATASPTRTAGPSNNGTFTQALSQATHGHDEGDAPGGGGAPGSGGAPGNGDVRGSGTNAARVASGTDTTRGTIGAPGASGTAAANLGNGAIEDPPSSTAAVRAGIAVDGSIAANGGAAAGGIVAADRGAAVDGDATAGKSKDRTRGGEGKDAAGTGSSPLPETMVGPLAGLVQATVIARAPTGGQSPAQPAGMQLPAASGGASLSDSAGGISQTGAITLAATPAAAFMATATAAPPTTPKAAGDSPASRALTSAAETLDAGALTAERGPTGSLAGAQVLYVRGQSQPDSQQPGGQAQPTGAQVLTQHFLDELNRARGLLDADKDASPGSAQSPTATAQAPLRFAAATIQSPVGSASFGQDLVHDIARLVTANLPSGTSTVQMNLNPPNLGPLQVTVSVAAGVAQVSFASGHEAVREAVSANLAALQQALAQQGISLGQTQVGSQGGQAAYSPQSQAFFERRSGSGSGGSRDANGHGPTGIGGARAAALPPAHEVIAGTHAPDPSRLVDTKA
ncbi:MAG: flagellar hook-length control protein FliK [Candidimonas sp.]|nr:MAG: flagellar hook-length control protein FliK [Candidimonas sp.]